ncbi:MAG: hypothetical protein Q8M31_23865 [Beijerinckiaceae bacterium]|nr:hypothetical protein [Beijerinckiaceae bacterium]
MQKHHWTGAISQVVMRGLDPRIQADAAGLDSRVKPGCDDGETMQQISKAQAYSREVP